MPVLYVRISDENYAYVRELAERSRMPLVRTIDVLLEAAREHRWTTLRQSIEVEEAGQ